MFCSIIVLHTYKYFFVCHTVISSYHDNKNCYHYRDKINCSSSFTHVHCNALCLRTQSWHEVFEANTPMLNEMSEQLIDNSAAKSFY